MPMRRCPSCERELPDDSRFCSGCGEDLVSSTSAPTRPPSDSTASVSPISGEGGFGTRFIPGTVLAGRYRLIGPLGRGGMGEVYRADDLKLGQPVALKFLPQELADHPDRLARFYAEVRLARQITHPNVCRVYDVGEVEGQHFISMEYVDGEDLSSLLRRIGRLPETKALEIARQLCAGLAAAHDQGILHRDLKPANIMIDGQGRARITDFGLASFAQDVRGNEIGAGTPVYMAPEQISGRQVSTRSDIYSLGLVLYETLTGKPAHKGRSVAELLREHQTPQSSPSTLVDGLDPAVERVILHCLDRDPEKRPASALSVALILPGGDPLAAALAAGETPSPEMVAAARREGGLPQLVAGLLLAVFLIALVGQVFLQRHTLLVHQVDLSRSPEVLRVGAREVLERLGYEPGRYFVAGLSYDDEFVQKMGEPGFVSGLSEGVGSVRPAPIHFWYRQAESELLAENGAGWVTPEDPALNRPGMILTKLDPGGRLVRFVAVPTVRPDEGTLGGEVDWSAIFGVAGLGPENFDEVTPIGVPPVYCEGRRAWNGRPGSGRLEEIRVEAGWVQGRVNYFAVLGPWHRPPGSAAEDVPGSLAVMVAAWIVMGVLVLGGLALARWNLVRGRGDRKGAFRLAVGLSGVNMAVWALRVDHVLGADEVTLLVWSLGNSLLLGLCIWLLYIALEPSVRRFWPDTIVSWSRILGGRVHDSLVGRDLLVGVTSGAALGLLEYLSHLASAATSIPDPPSAVPLDSLIGLRHGLSLLGQTLTMSVINPLALTFLILLMRVIFRRQWLAIAIVFVVFTSLAVAVAGVSVTNALFAVVLWGLAIWVLVRFGLVSSIAMFYVATFTSVFPFSADFSVWYSARALFLYLLIGAGAAYAFYLSLGGRKLISAELLEP